MPGQTAGWERLRLRLRSAAPPLYPPAPRPAGSPAADCEVCRGPVRPGFARCYQCDRHALLGSALLADAVVPISYAIKGTPFADDLWRYKSVPVPSSSAPPSASVPPSASAPAPALVPTPASAPPSASLPPSASPSAPALVPDARLGPGVGPGAAAGLPDRSRPLRVAARRNAAA